MRFHELFFDVLLVLFSQSSLGCIEVLASIAHWGLPRKAWPVCIAVCWLTLAPCKFPFQGSVAPECFSYGLEEVGSPMTNVLFDLSPVS